MHNMSTEKSCVHKVQIIRVGSQENVNCHVATRLKTMFAGFTINETSTKCLSNYSIISKKSWEVVLCSTKNLTEGKTQRRDVQLLELRHLRFGFHINTLFTKHHAGSRSNGHQWEEDIKNIAWANSWKTLRQLCGGDLHSAAHPWIFAGSLASRFTHPAPATTAGCNESAMRYQQLSDASSDVLDMSSVSALVSGMRASRLECSASQRKGMFVMQCTLPDVVENSEDPEHACEPPSKKQRLSSECTLPEHACDPRASAVLVARASRCAKRLEEAEPCSVFADTLFDQFHLDLASVLFKSSGMYHYQRNAEVLRETPSQQEVYTQVGLILEVLQAARETAGVKEGSLNEQRKKWRNTC